MQHGADESSHDEDQFVSKERVYAAAVLLEAVVCRDDWGGANASEHGWFVKMNHVVSSDALGTEALLDWALSLSDVRSSSITIGSGDANNLGLWHG